MLFPSYVCGKHKHDPVQKITQHSWKPRHISLVCSILTAKSLMEIAKLRSLKSCFNHDSNYRRRSVAVNAPEIQTKRRGMVSEQEGPRTNMTITWTLHISHRTQWRAWSCLERTSAHRWRMWSLANIYHLPSGNYMRAMQGLNIVDQVQNTTSSRRKQPIWKLHQYATVSF